jgi:hypothetical protein
MQVRDAATNRVQAVSTATLVHAEIPPDCIRAEVIADCLTRQRNPAQGEGSQNPAAAPARPNAMPGRSP